MHRPIIILVNIIFLVAACIWCYKDMDFEPFLAAGGFIYSLITMLFLEKKGELLDIFNEGPMATIKPDDMIRYGFKSKFAKDSLLYDSMIEYIGLDKPYLLDCNIDILLTKPILSSPDKYCYNLSYSFVTINNVFILAIADSTSLAESLINRNLANEVIVPSLSTKNELEVLKQVSLKEYESVRGNKYKKEHNFTQLSAKEKAKHIGSNYGDFENCYFYKVNFKKDLSTEVKLRFSAKCDLNFSDGYCYWTSPQLMYVKRISVDLSGLDVDVTEFRIQTFVSFINELSIINSVTSKYTIESNDWVNRGQGIAVIFPTKITNIQNGK